MMQLKSGNSTGHRSVDQYISKYKDEFTGDLTDEFVFFNAKEDVRDLSVIGLHGSFKNQLPEFVLEIQLEDCALYHAFTLYDNESGVHIFTIKNTLDHDTELFLQQESK